MKPSQVIGSMQIAHSPVLHGTLDVENSMQIAHSLFCMELRTWKIPCSEVYP